MIGLTTSCVLIVSIDNAHDVKNKRQLAALASAYTIAGIYGSGGKIKAWQDSESERFISANASGLGCPFNSN